jgi:hypothetical protein
MYHRTPDACLFRVALVVSIARIESMALRPRREP